MVESKDYIIRVTKIEDQMSKTELFMENIISKYHPVFVNSKELNYTGLKHAAYFNVELLIEETMAAVGGYNFVNGVGYDFDDKDWSDAKTTSVTECDRQVQIKGVETKIGSLRVVVYNPIAQHIAYFYVPTVDVNILKRQYSKKNSYSEIIKFYYTKKNDYGKFEKYRLNDFVQLAKACD